MRNSGTFTLSVWVTVLLALPLNADEPKKVDSPRTALERYISALKTGDIKRAIELTASFKHLSSRGVKDETEDYSKGMKAGDFEMKLVSKSEKVIEDCAVVTFVDGGGRKPDYDPAFLIKQDGKWKVLFELTDWEEDTFDLSKSQQKRFKELAEWFDEESDRLYDVWEKKKIGVKRVDNKALDRNRQPAQSSK